MLNLLLEVIEKLINQGFCIANKETPDKVPPIIENSIEVPKVKGLNDIIGLKDLKKMLKTFVILPKTQPQLFHNRKVCNSILLYGPPGTGKTRLAHALAGEAGANFYSVSAGDVLSRYIGQTEKYVKKILTIIKKQCAL